MDKLPAVAIGFVAAEHILFLILEMFLWTKPIGFSVFKHKSPEAAEHSAVVAANMGLYNGFLAAGLIWGFKFAEPKPDLHVVAFFLICVVVAGAYGGYSVSWRVFVSQALPAALALALALLWAA